MIAGLWGALAALPELIALAREVFHFFQGLMKEDPRQFIKEAGEAFAKVNNAKTTEEKLDAASDLQNLFKKL